MRSAVIVAAGSSNRFGENKMNKQFFGKSVLQHSVDAFVGIADEIIVVGAETEGAKCVAGGATRSQSVLCGLAAVSPETTVVAIHDGARPFVSRSLVEKLFCEGEKFGSAVPKLPVIETLWQQSEEGLLSQNRDEFFTVQTPQVFDCEKLKWAFEHSQTNHTDESTLFFEAFGTVHFVEGEFTNRKITYPNDLPNFSVGVGMDVHAFGEGNGFVLGGEHIVFDKKLVGHSDADVLAHAICDAVLSASGNRDIGVQFPDTDDKYLGANSLVLLNKCVELAKQKGFAVENVSAVIICQQPKISPHINKMAQNLATVLKVPPHCVNLSATTTEHLGALGNGDGIAVQAEALLSQR